MNNHAEFPSGLESAASSSSNLVAHPPQSPKGDDMSARPALGSPFVFEGNRARSSLGRGMVGMPPGWRETLAPLPQFQQQQQHYNGYQHGQREDANQNLAYRGLQGLPLAAGVIQLPPLDLANVYFEDTKSAKAFLQQPVWRPKSDTYGVPRYMTERLRYVKRIHDAIVDISDIQDADMWPKEGSKFQIGGMWAHPRDIEAVAHDIVEIAIKIHRVGVLGLRFVRDEGLGTFHPFDAILTFPERIFFMAHLLRHFKLKADSVMRNSFIEEYLARIWSELSDQPSFRATWGTLNAEEQLGQLDARAYQGVSQRPPTQKQRAEWLRRFEFEAPGIQPKQHQQQEEQGQEQGQEQQVQEQEQQFHEQLAEGEEGQSLPPRKRRHTGGSS